MRMLPAVKRATNGLASRVDMIGHLPQRDGRQDPNLFVEFGHNPSKDTKGPQEVYTTYNMWCKAASIEPMSPTAVCPNGLTERGFERTVKPVSISHMMAGNPSQTVLD